MYAFFGKVSLDGEKQWVKTITSEDATWLFDIIWTADGRLLATGSVKLQG